MISDNNIYVEYKRCQITTVSPILKSVDHPLVDLNHTVFHLSMWSSLGSDSTSNKIEGAQNNKYEIEQL